MSRRYHISAVLLAALTAAACSVGDAGVGEADLGPTLELASSEASNPTTAVDPATGDALVAWVETEDGESNVLLTRLSPDGSVEPPTRVNDTPGDAAAHFQAPAQVAAAPNGDVYVLWTNNLPIEGRRFPASDLRFARSGDGGRTFEPTITVNDDAGGPPTSHTFHNLLVSPDGTLYASWLDSRDGGEAATAAAEGIALSEGQEASVSAGEPGAGPNLRIAASHDGGRTFLSSFVVDQNACPCCRTAMAIGPDGELYVGWRKVYEGNIRDVVLARSDDGGETFGTPVLVHEDGWVFPGCPHAGPALDVDAEGSVHVVWYTGKPGAAGLFYAQSQNRGESFSEPTPLATAAVVAPSLSSLVAENGGALWMTWEDRRQGAPELHTVRTTLDGVNERMRSEVIQGSHPSVSAVGETRVFAWLDGGTVLARVGFAASRSD
jgi:hypothetical protein